MIAYSNGFVLVAIALILALIVHVLRLLRRPASDGDTTLAELGWCFWLAGWLWIVVDFIRASGGFQFH